MSEGFSKGPAQRQRAHHRKASIWLVIGLVGVIDYAIYLIAHPHRLLAAVHPLAGSIPVLFFISVYANYVGHRSAEEANEAEMSGSTDARAAGDD